MVAPRSNAHIHLGPGVVVQARGQGDVVQDGQPAVPEILVRKLLAEEDPLLVHRADEDIFPHAHGPAHVVHML